MEKFLEKLRQKPAGTKFFIVLAATAAVIIPVFLTWGFSMKNDLVGTYEYESGEGPATDSNAENYGLLSVGKAVGGVASGIWSFLSSALTQPYPEQNNFSAGGPAGILINEAPGVDPLSAEIIIDDYGATSSTTSTR